MARIQFDEDIPHIVEAKVVDIVTRMLDRKRFAFEIELKWSDGNKTTSYRSYSDFFDFQCQLLIDFPEESGLKKRGSGDERDRCIPYLPGKKLFKRSTIELARERRPKIEEYLTQLVALPKNVSHSDRVLKFFRSNWQEDRLRSHEACGALAHGNTSSAVKYSVKHLSKSRGDFASTNSFDPLVSQLSFYFRYT